MKSICTSSLVNVPVIPWKVFFQTVEKEGAEQIKEAIVFEESAGHEETIMLFFRYLLQLEKYEAGMMNSTSLWRGILCPVHVSSQEKKLKKTKY